MNTLQLSKSYTAISRKVVAETVHATIRKVIWDTIDTLVLDTVAVKPTFVSFLQHSQTYVVGLFCHSLKFL